MPFDEMYNLKQAALYTALPQSVIEQAIEAGKLRSWRIVRENETLVKRSHLFQFAQTVDRGGIVIKGLVLHQPWATLMALEVKRNETRPMRTRYRGPVVICAAKVIPEYALAWLLGTSAGAGAARRELVRAGYSGTTKLPTGAALAVVRLHDCVPTYLDEGYPFEGDELEYGNYGPGRYVWVTDRLQRFTEEVPVRSMQGLFNYTGPLPGVDLESLTK